MNFARKQLEKYGWSEGKGLGKYENGISEALKPKIKRSVTGVGHDPASEFNEHWWSALYDKAAGNVEVEEKNGKTKKIKTKDDLTISTNTWQINKGSIKEAKEQYSDFFVRKAVLTKGGNKVEKVNDSDSDEDIEMEKKDALKMTDEELFAACGGRTAHKGARHGLKATGKLARIAQQEAMLLSQSRFNGYSHAKKMKESVDDTTLKPEDDTACKKKKKKKRRRCFSNEVLEDENSMAEQQTLLPEESTNETSIKIINDDSRKCESKEDKVCDGIIENEESSVKPKKKKKRKIEQEEAVAMETDIVEIAETEHNLSKKKKKKKSKQSE